MGDKDVGEINPVGEVGEMRVGDCTADANAELMLRRVGLVESLLALAKELFRDLEPRVCFCLNFSSHRVVKTFSFPSGLPQVLAKNIAFSRICASVRGKPCF